MSELWSCGGGVQSTAIAALIVQGKLSPTRGVIVDTERELSTTWKYLDAVTLPALRAIGFELTRVPKSEFATVDLFSKNGSLLIPAYTTQGGEVGKLPTYCSNEWKTRVMQRWAKSVGMNGATVLIGFSTDEMRRVKTITGKWPQRYPLVELGMSRADCMALVRDMGWPEPPRSSCWMCPNHRMDEWRWIEKNAPQDMIKAAVFEAEVQERDPHAWLTDQQVPLYKADFKDANENIFEHCESGMCYV